MEEEGDTKCQKVTMDQWSSDACQPTNKIIVPPLKEEESVRDRGKVQACSTSDGTTLYFMNQSRQ